MEKEHKMNPEQGHWILAKMGKKVLRPGGKELTLKMIENLAISENDDVVEFAPGMGFTAEISLSKNPKTYTGVELNQEAVNGLAKKFTAKNVRFVVGNASASTLESQSVTKVYGEAMLTMQADHRKSEIIAEAFRILKSNGCYAIHELGITPNEISAEKKAEIQKELAKVIKVNARPLTTTEWATLLEKEGFVIKKIETNPMHLLELKRIFADEGFCRTLKFMCNILLNSQARKRIFGMRSVFRKYEKHLNAVSIIAQKL